jgi:hypothetical protein
MLGHLGVNVPDLRIAKMTERNEIRCGNPFPPVFPA